MFQTFRNSFTEESTTRFLRYAPLVRTLVHEEQTVPPRFAYAANSDLSDEIFFILWSIGLPPSHNGLIFPNMDHLIWSTESPQGISQVLFFQHHRITKYDISFPSTYIYTPTIRRAIACLRTSKLLQELRIGFTDPDGFGNLNDRSIGDAVCDWAENQVDAKAIAFTGLIIHQPLRAVQGHSHLRDLSLEIIHYAEFEDIFEFSTSIATSCPHLTQLRLKFERTRALPNLFISVTFATLTPLLRLRQLSELVISSDAILCLESDDVKPMAESWTRLQTLSLTPRPALEFDTGTSFTILTTFARHFTSSLQSFTHRFRIDEEKLPEVSESFPGSLSKLNVGNTELGTERAFEVARFLRRLHPRPLKLAWDDDDWSMGAWNAVKIDLDNGYALSEQHVG